MTPKQIKISYIQFQFYNNATYIKKKLVFTKDIK